MTDASANEIEQAVEYLEQINWKCDDYSPSERRGTVRLALAELDKVTDRD